MKSEYRHDESTQRYEMKVTSVTMLCDKFRAYAKTAFVKGGAVTSHYRDIDMSMRILDKAFGSRPANDVGAPELARLRDIMVKSPVDGTVLSMKTVNGRLACMKSAFTWAREKGLVSRATALDVAAVQPLQRGRTPAKASTPIRPVPLASVRATQKHLHPTHKDMVELQLLTGMRSGELVLIRPCDIKRHGVCLGYTALASPLTCVNGL